MHNNNKSMYINNRHAFTIEEAERTRGIMQRESTNRFESIAVYGEIEETGSSRDSIPSSPAAAAVTTTPPPSSSSSFTPRRGFPERWRREQQQQPPVVVAAAARPLAPIPLEITENLQPGETYQRNNITVGVNIVINGQQQQQGNDDEPPAIIVIINHQGGGAAEVLAVSHTMRYSRPIPEEEGFTYIDIFRMASILQVTAPWLADQLTNYEEEFDGWDAGPHVADLANLHGLMNNNNNPAAAQAILNRIRAQVQAQAANNPAMQAVIRRIVTAQQQQPNAAAAVVAVVAQAPQLILISTTDDVSDDEVCTICMESSADTPGMGWSFAQGCASHPFHSDCIQQWQGGACPLCRAPLAVRASM